MKNFDRSIYPVYESGKFVAIHVPSGMNGKDYAKWLEGNKDLVNSWKGIECEPAIQETEPETEEPVRTAPE